MATVDAHGYDLYKPLLYPFS